MPVERVISGQSHSFMEQDFTGGVNWLVLILSALLSA